MVCSTNTNFLQFLSSVIFLLLSDHFLLAIMHITDWFFFFFFSEKVYFNSEGDFCNSEYLENDTWGMKLSWIEQSTLSLNTCSLHQMPWEMSSKLSSYCQSCIRTNIVIYNEGCFCSFVKVFMLCAWKTVPCSPNNSFSIWRK